MRNITKHALIFCLSLFSWIFCLNILLYFIESTFGEPLLYERPSILSQNPKNEIKQIVISTITLIYPISYLIYYLIRKIANKNHRYSYKAMNGTIIAGMLLVIMISYY